MSTKRTKATIKPSPCNISGEMGEKIAGLLHECNIQAVVVPEEIEEPLPLILPDEQNIGQQDTEIETGEFLYFSFQYGVDDLCCLLFFIAWFITSF